MVYARFCERLRGKLPHSTRLIIGIIGSKQDALKMLENVKSYLQHSLKLSLSEEKTAIRHHRKGVHFLGYELKTGIHRHAIKKVKFQNRYTHKRSSNAQILKLVSEQTMAHYVQKKRWGNFVENQTIHRPELLELSDVEIILSHNAEMRGFANYYSLASNFHQLDRLFYLGQSSLIKTLSRKYKRSVKETYTWLKKGKKRLGIVRNGKEYFLVRPKDIKRNRYAVNPKIDQLPLTQIYSTRTELESRIQARKCEYCGKEEGYFEVHHVRKLADLSAGKEPWQRLMSARRRKTLILCAGHKASCHNLLHAGRLPDFRFRSEGESRVLLT